jgi:pilus assembly protein CpaF
MRARVVFLDGDVIEGESEVAALSKAGFPLIPDGGSADEPAWIPSAGIRYVEQPGPAAPGAEDPREASGDPKLMVRFLNGEVVRTYRDDTFGQEGEGFRLLRWDRPLQRFTRLLIPAHTLKGVFTVSEWPAELPSTAADAAATTSGPTSGELAMAGVEAALVAGLVPRLRNVLADIPDGALASRDEGEYRIAVERNLDAVFARAYVRATPGLRSAVLNRIVDDAFGWGPIDPLLEDPAVSEIMINSPVDVFVSRSGQVTRSDVAFEDEAQLQQVIRRIVGLAGCQVDAAHPIVDARLPNGSRINAMLPPASPRGATLTVRKFKSLKVGLYDLVDEQIVDHDMAEVLDAAVNARANIIVSGPPGTGKTTMLSTLAAMIPAGQRIITIEKSLELQIGHQNLVSLEAAGSNGLTIGELLRNCLRMRPDRIIVGEVTGGEAFDILQAIAAGHEGGMSSVRADTAREAIGRFESFARTGSPGLSQETIRGQVLGAIDLVVHVGRFEGGRHCVTEISELVGFDQEGPVLQQLFVAERGPAGLEFRATGNRPKLLQKILLNQVTVPGVFSAPAGPVKPAVLSGADWTS